MLKLVNRKAITQKRHNRIRKKVSGTAEFPRLAVYRSGKHIYAQLIDDVGSTTLASASTVDKALKAKIKSGANVESAKIVGQTIAERAKAQGIECIVFDRGGNLYHGRVAALAEAAREAGLMF
jgi:large subunit ribosomal protein L18